MARGDILNEVFEYIRNHRGEVITIDEACKATGYTKLQVQGAIRTIQAKRIWPVSTWFQGRTWKAGLSETVVDPVVSPPHFGSNNPAPEPEGTDPRTRSVRQYRDTGGQRATDQAALDGDALPQIRVTLPTRPTASPPVPHAHTRPEVVRKAVVADQSDHLFECMGTRPGGKLLIRRDDGILYEATLEEL